ncbi:MAG: ATP-binding protein [Pirellulales bacterium]
MDKYLRSLLPPALADDFCAARRGPTAPETQAALDGLLARRLPTMTMMMALYAGADVLVQVGMGARVPASRELTAAYVQGALLTAAWFVLIWRPVPARWANAYGTALATMLLAQSLFVLYVRSDPSQTLHLLFIVLGGGFFLTRPSWYCALSVAAFLGWWMIAGERATTGSWVPALCGLATAVVLGLYVNWDQRRNFLQMLRLTSVLGRHSAEASDAKDRAEEATRVKGDFLANMSHEIRTPMSAILGFAEVIVAQGNLTAAQLQAIETIRRNGHHLLKIINDVLDFSRVDAGKMKLDLRSVSPRDLVDEVITLLLPQAECKGLKLVGKFDPAVPDVVETDPTRLRQILVNIVGNALKFTERGSVTVEVRVVAWSTRSRIEFDVVDTGIGMSESEASRLFEPFAQADPSTSRRFGGTGLGLSIARRLAKLLDGDVTIVQSAPGEGTTVRATIVSSTTSAAPAKQASASSWPACLDVPQPPPPTVGEVQAETLTGCRILVAEDGLDNQRLIRWYLERAGAKVSIVDNGQDACLAALDRVDQAEAFDVVVMDMQMPKLDGYQAASLLRQQGFAEPIIALTAHAMPGDSDKCLAAGCNAYASKPIQRGELLDLVNKHWQRRRDSTAEPASECRSGEEVEV